MKNKFFIFFLSVLLFHNLVKANQFELDASNIIITNNGNLITANQGIALLKDKSIQIEGSKFEYNKNLKLLSSLNSITLVKKKNLEIKSDRLEYDEIRSILTANGNVEIFNKIEKYKIQTNKITLDINQNLLNSEHKTILRDKFNNTYTSEKFEYDLNIDILKIQEVEFEDKEKNNFKIEIAYLNFNENKLIGKDINIDLNNKSFNSENNPRLKGRSINLNKDLTELTNAVFTLCKKNEGCPPWQLSAKKIVHDKNKKNIQYSNAWLKIYDLPVFYLPKFFHPDPSVNRQSGFLMPGFKNSPNGNSYLYTPYFHVLSGNRDITYMPRFFDSDKFLLQTEFRQVGENSSHLADISFFSEKDKNLKNHLFYNFNKKFDFNNFYENSFNIKVQQTNNDTYLKGNNIKSILADNFDMLESSMNLDIYSDDMSINSNLIVFENLNKSDSNKYEYIFPSVKFTKNYNSNLNGNLKLVSNSHFKNYDTNVNEKININDLIYTSFPKITNSGFYNNYELLLKNANTGAKNSTNYKNKNSLYLSSLFQFNSSLPLIKKNERYQKILKPKLSIKLAPNNEKNISKEDQRLDINNLFSLNRLASNETIEGGVSLTYGNEFYISNLEDKRNIFSLSLANNLRIDENNNLPKTNQLDSKTSNFFGEITYSPNDIITSKYNFSLKNNLHDLTYENLITQINLDKFVTTFDYQNENTSENNSYLLSSAKVNFNNSNNLTFSTRENKTKNLTEYYNLIYQYKNDCLAASIEYNKAYYSDREIKPEESIFFKLTIIPFGETSTPNLFK